MKKTSTILCFSTVLAISLLAVNDTKAAEAADMTLEGVLEGYYEAAGGLDKLSQINALKLVGERIEAARVGKESTVPFAVTFANPDLLRLDLEIRDDNYTQAYDGEKGWQIWPAWGNYATQDLPDELLTGLRKEFEMVNELYRYKEKGHQLEWVGPTTIADQDVYHLRIVHSTGELRDLFVDAETFLPAQMTTSRNVDGTDYSIKLDFGDYRSVDGVVLAHESVFELAGNGIRQLVKLVVNELTVNPQLPVEYFSRPVDLPAEEVEPAAEMETGSEPSASPLDASETPGA